MPASLGFQFSCSCSLLWGILEQLHCTNLMFTGQLSIAQIGHLVIHSGAQMPFGVVCVGSRAELELNVDCIEFVSILTCQLQAS